MRSNRQCGTIFLGLTMRTEESISKTAGELERVNRTVHTLKECLLPMYESFYAYIGIALVEN